MKINGSLVFDASSASEIQNLRVEKVSSNPTAVASDVGRIIYNTTTKQAYVGRDEGGSVYSWQALATGGSAFSQAEGDAIETSLGAGINSNGTFNADGFTAFTSPFTAPTSFTEAINQLATQVSGNDTLYELGDVTLSASLPAGPAFLYINGGNWVDHTLVLADVSNVTTTATELNQLASAGAVQADFIKLHAVTASAADLNLLAGAQAGTGAFTGATLSSTELSYLDGATSNIQSQLNNKQPLDATLTALAAFSATGIVVSDGADSFFGRSLVQPSAGLTITNGSGVAGNPTFALADDLAAVEALATTGFAVRTGTSTWTTRSVTGTSGRIVVSNGDGVTSDANVDLDTVTNPGNGGTFLKLTTDSYGRVVNTTAVVAGDITALVDSTYVNVSGDTMSGNLNMGSNNITGLANPVNGTDAANKQYVDGVASNLNIHNAVEVATVSELSATYANGTTDTNGGLGVGATLTATANGAIVIDGYSGLIVGSRVLVKNQYGNAIGAVVVSGGTGYTVSDTLTLVGGTGTAATFNVDTVSSGVITAVSLVSAGDYTVQPADPVATTGGTGSGATLNVTWNTVANGIYVVSTVGDGSNPYVLTRAVDSDNGVIGNELKPGDFVYITEGTVNASTGWTQTAVGTATNDAIKIGTDDVSYTQFSGAGTYTAGTGLTLTGTTFSVDLGAGIAELPAGEVGIDLYNTTTGALILTTNGTARSTGAASQLFLLLKSAGGLTQDVNGLYIPNAGVTNAMLANSTLTLNGDSGTDTIALGETLLISGVTAQGVSVAVTDNTFTVTVANATTSTKGVASFASGDFDVTSGSVTIKAGGVDNAQLAFSTLNFVGSDASSDTVALGETLTFADVTGGHAGGALLQTSVATNTVTLSARQATTTALGVASFNSSHFGVTAGAVSLSTTLGSGGITNVASAVDTAATNDILTFNGTNWTNSTPAAVGGTIAIGNLSDVGTANPASTAQVLVADGSAFQTKKIFHKQIFTSSTSWTVTHSLNQQFVNVTVMVDNGDSTYDVVIPQSITMNSTTVCTVTFNSAVAGAVAVTGIEGA